MTLEEYKTQFYEDVRAEASLNSTTPDDQFLNSMVKMLEEMEVLYDTQIRYFGQKGKYGRFLQVDAYSYDETDKSIVLCINDYHDDDNPEVLTLTRIDSLYKRMINFLEEVYEDTIINYCDDSNEFIKIGRDFKRRLETKFATEAKDETIERIKLLIFTNSELSSRVKTIDKGTFLDRKVDLDIWSIERLYEIALSGQEKEIITININDFGAEGVDCLKAEISGTEEYESYLAIIPGKLLSDIYLKYGSRLLEGNVRAFLSVKGKVNQGIRKTIIGEPTKFFTYNNGIATTAKGVSIEKKDGRTIITSITDLQIINGGQTTASLTSAYIKKESLLGDIFVPMKLTVVKNDQYDDMVQKISKYANSQNKVTDADMFSNHPFHISFEQLSKKIYAPAKGANVYQTMWYYERSRGKYEQEQFKLKIGSKEKEDFKRKYPKSQVIKKEELAKYMTTLDCKPHIVSLGRAKCMNEFAKEIDAKYKADEFNSQINEFFFKRAICAAIIFRETDSLVYASSWYQVGGYKLNIIPYTISKVLSSVPSGFSIDYTAIWKNQTMYTALLNEIQIVAKMANDFITDSKGMIVTEYCKKYETWENFRKTPYKPSKDFLDSLISDALLKSSERSAKIDKKDDVKINIMNEIYKFGTMYWERLFQEGLNRKLLGHQDVDLLKLAIDFTKGKRFPSDAQSKIIWSVRQKLGKNGVMIE